MADENILRVGAEFDVAPLIEGIQESVDSFDQLNDAYAQVAASAEASGDTWLQNAANLMAQGIAAQDAAQNLVRWGATQQQADAAVQAVTAAVSAQVPAIQQQAAATNIASTTIQTNTTATTANIAAQTQKTVTTTAQLAPTAALGGATQAATAAQTGQTTATVSGAAQIAALQTQVQQLALALQNLQQQIANTTTRTGGMTSAMGAARVEAGALTGSTGMMVGGLARVAAQSAVLAPLIQAAFPVFAILAFIAILDAAIKKLEEWGDIARKSAEAQAAFDLSIEKSFESMESARQHLVGLSSSQAELSERMRTSGDKVIDLTETIKKANERLEDNQGYWKRLKEGLGIVDIAVEESIGTIDKSTRDLELWNENLAQSYSHAKDLAPEITEVTTKLAALHAEQAAVPKGDITGTFNAAQRVKIETEIYNQLISKQGEFLFQQKALQIESDQKTLEEHEKVVRARVAFDESSARAELRAHAITLEEERAMLLADEEKRKRSEESILDSKVATLRREASAQLITQKDLSEGIKQAAEERNAIEIASAQRRDEIINSTDQNILRRTLLVGEARIEAEHKVSGELAKLAEDRAKRAFQEADTVKELESTATELTEKHTLSIQDQITKLQQQAALIESTLTIKKPSGAFGQAVTADLGTPEIAGQLDQIKQLDDAKYKQLLEFDAEVRVLQSKEVDDAERTEKQKADRVKRIQAEELETSLRSIAENLDREKSLYDENITHLQELQEDKKITLREFTEAAIMFAQQEFNARKQTLQQEVEELNIARAKDIITEENYAKRVEEIHKQLTKIEEEEIKEVTKFQQEEDKKREQSMQQTMSKITSEFVQGINKMIQGQQSLGRIAVQTADQIALNLIDKGIERVVEKYGEDFLKLVAQHTQFITQFIADHSTFLATLLGIQTTSDATKLSKTIAANTAQITSEAGVSFAAGFASVMAALPFPANVATAPEVAAQAAADTEAGIFFERGGIVDATLHHGEMVLPERISSAVMGAIPAISNFNKFAGDSSFASASRVSSTTTHNNYNIPITVNQARGKTTAEEIHAAVKKGIRSGHL